MLLKLIAVLFSTAGISVQAAAITDVLVDSIHCRSAPMLNYVTSSFVTLVVRF